MMAHFMCVCVTLKEELGGSDSPEKRKQTPSRANEESFTLELNLRGTADTPRSCDRRRSSQGRNTVV